MPPRGNGSDDFETRGWDAGEALKGLGPRSRAMTEGERARKPGRSAGRKFDALKGG